MGNIPVVFLCAGLSKRFDGQPKQLEIINNNKTFIEMQFENSLIANPGSFYLIVSCDNIQKFKNKLGDDFNGIKINYIMQPSHETNHSLWGIPDAISSLYDKIKKPFILCNGSVLYSKNCFKTCREALLKNKNTTFICHYSTNINPNNTDKKNIVYGSMDTVGSIQNQKIVNGNEICNTNMVAIFNDFATNVHDTIIKKKNNNIYSAGYEFNLNELVNHFITKGHNINYKVSTNKIFILSEKNDVRRLVNFLQNNP